PFAAHAAEMKFGGEFRTRGFYTDNLSDLNSGIKDREVFNDDRFRLKVSAAEGLATGVVLVDFFNGSSGQDVATLNSTPTGNGTGDRTSGSAGFGGSLDTVRLKEAYLRVSWPEVHLVAGRQGVTLGHGLILDDTADAFSIAIPMGWASLTVMDLLIYTPPSRGSGNSSVYLADLNLAPTAGLKSSLFALLLKDRGPNLFFGPTPFFNPCGIGSTGACPISDFGGDYATVAVLGWAMDQHGPALRWATEVNYLKGSIRTHEATTLNPDGRGIEMKGINGLGQIGGTLRQIDIQLTGLYASGQKAKDLPQTKTGRKLNINAISPNFVLGNILTNNETVSDRDGGNIGGLTSAKLALGWIPGGAIRGELAGIRAWTTERPASGASRDLGWELDANAFWRMDPSLLLTGGFGILFPGDAWITLKGPGATDPSLKFSTKLTYTF
ncbi:MAG: hypothetical protein HY283_10435, partial [Nitrospirae bacterium]|nr:hypothetical protein [Nitrospirota bacterium]